MITENLSALQIHQLTQAQYDRELAAGRLDPNALYLTPAKEIGSGVAKAEINDIGELIVTYVDGTEENLGWVLNATGECRIIGHYKVYNVRVAEDIDTIKDSIDDGVVYIFNMGEEFTYYTGELNYNFIFTKYGLYECTKRNNKITSANFIVEGTYGEKESVLKIYNGEEYEESAVLIPKSSAGSSGVYVGSGDMPEDCNIQIDPDGDADFETFISDEVKDVIAEELSNLNLVVPTKISAFENDKGYLTSFTETDPTVPSWAKQSTKPTYTANEVGADTSGTAESKVATHNVSNVAHTDIRDAIVNTNEELEHVKESLELSIPYINKLYKVKSYEDIVNLHKTLGADELVVINVGEAFEIPIMRRYTSNGLFESGKVIRIKFIDEDGETYVNVIEDIATVPIEDDAGHLIKYWIDDGEGNISEHQVLVLNDVGSDSEQVSKNTADIEKLTQDVSQIKTDIGEAETLLSSI